MAKKKLRKPGVWRMTAGIAWVTAWFDRCYGRRPIRLRIGSERSETPVVLSISEATRLRLRLEKLIAYAEQEDG